MDPVRISETPDPLPRGSSLFFPFECYNLKPNGTYSEKLAVNLPPKKTIHEVRNFLMDARLIGRKINYTEFADKEVINSPELMNYLATWKGRY